MEFALEPGMPLYSGGLGVLAGDTVRSAADLRVPMVGMSILYRKGYFYQRIDDAGLQAEEPVEWIVEDYLTEMPVRTSVTIEGRTVRLRAWRYEVVGSGGYCIPVYFLDADMPDNAPEDRSLTHVLYGGDQRYRLCQEVILGIGGVRMLRSLGHDQIERFHMNEGHSSLLVLELLHEEMKGGQTEALDQEDIDRVRERCVFTTHTPVDAGFDKFPTDLVNRVIGSENIFSLRKDIFCCDDLLNMTYLALTMSHYVNGVAKKHGEQSRLMFAGYPIDAITNGVHAASWVSEPFQKLYDRLIPGWRENNFSLRYALGIPGEDVWAAHHLAKRLLCNQVNREENAGMNDDVFTIGFARRATTYKRWDLLFHDIERIRGIASKAGPLQIIYAGKAHPRDEGGKQLIRDILRHRDILKEEIKIVFLLNYDIALARMITAGVDLWLNTPQPPMEASGTSGMKAALNAVPSLSVLDGWWVEGHIEGVTGWSVGDRSKGAGEPDGTVDDSRSLYDKLEHTIIPLYYNDRKRFIDVMKSCVALNGSFFNTQRMMQEYVLKAYFL